MSFMFHPYPYADPAAVNKIEVPQSVEKNLTKGILNVAKKLSALFEDGVKTIGVDAYPGAEYETLINVLKQQLTVFTIAKAKKVFCLPSVRKNVRVALSILNFHFLLKGKNVF